MAAVAEEIQIPQFNIEEEIMSLDDFIKRCNSIYTNKTHVNEYYIQLNVSTHSYICTINVDINQYTLNIMGESANDIFLILDFYFKDNSITSFVTTHVTFKQIIHPTSKQTLSKLESIIYIRCLFLRMISVKIYEISDSAIAVCKDTRKDYKLLLYRIFVKKSGSFVNAQNLSIYYKFFNKKYNYNKKYVLSEELNFEKLQQYLDTLREQTKYVDTLTEIANKGDKSCTELSTQLQIIQDELFQDISLKSILTEIFMKYGKFIVNNEDCIYYPKQTRNKNAAGGKRSHKKKNKKRKTRKNIKPL
jgi:hypothetical protein